MFHKISYALLVVSFLSSTGYADTDYACQSDCLNKGYMLQYCQEACSYGANPQSAGGIDTSHGVVGALNSLRQQQLRNQQQELENQQRQLEIERMQLENERLRSQSQVGGDQNVEQRGHKGVNEACSNSDECEGALVCSNNQCTSRGKQYTKKAGESCVKNDDCAFGSGLMCIENVCKTPW